MVVTKQSAQTAEYHALQNNRYKNGKHKMIPPNTM
jgi:hypothetical protein